MANYDIIGNIAIIKSDGKTKKELMKEAGELMRKPSVKTVLEKAGRVKGRLRTIKVKHLAGKKNFIAVCKENGCIFKMNVKTCYFSPRLSNERIEVAKIIKKTKKNAKVLVMFAGVGPYSVIVAKFAKPRKIVAVELGRECNKYARENLRLNKMLGNIELVQGDVKRRVNSRLGKFDVVVMPRPNLKESFLKEALVASKKGALIVYYGFARENEKDKMIEDLLREAKKFKRKIKILNVKEVGDIAPYKYRYRVKIKVRN